MNAFITRNRILGGTDILRENKFDTILLIMALGGIWSFMWILQIQNLFFSSENQNPKSTKVANIAHIWLVHSLLDFELEQCSPTSHVFFTEMKVSIRIKAKIRPEITYYGLKDTSLRPKITYCCNLWDVISILCMVSYSVTTGGCFWLNLMKWGIN